MARTNLATIDALFETAIAAEEQNPRITQEAQNEVAYKIRQIPTTAFGFSAKDENAESALVTEERNKRLAVIAQYRKDIAALEEALKPLDIALKAHGTTRGLSRVFMESNLYRLTVSPWGDVPIENDFIRSIVKATEKSVEWWIVATTAVVFGVGAIYGDYSFHPYWANLIAGLVAGVFGVMIGGVLNAYFLSPLVCTFLVPRKIRAAVGLSVLIVKPVKRDWQPGETEA